MALVVERITGSFGAEILGADLHRPPDRELVDTVNAAVADHAVVVLRDPRITDEEQVRFSRAPGAEPPRYTQAAARATLRAYGLIPHQVSATASGQVRDAARLSE